MSFRRTTCNSCGHVVLSLGGQGGEQTLSQSPSQSLGDACLRLSAHVSFLRRKGLLHPYFCAKVLAWLAVVESGDGRLGTPILSDSCDDMASCQNETPSMTSSEELDANLAFDSLVGQACRSPERED